MTQMVEPHSDLSQLAQINAPRQTDLTKETTSKEIQPQHIYEFKPTEIDTQFLTYHPELETAPSELHPLFTPSPKIPLKLFHLANQSNSNKKLLLTKHIENQIEINSNVVRNISDKFDNSSIASCEKDDKISDNNEKSNKNFNSKLNAFAIGLGIKKALPFSKIENVLKTNKENLSEKKEVFEKDNSKEIVDNKLDQTSKQNQSNKLVRHVIEDQNKETQNNKENINEKDELMKKDINIDGSKETVGNIKDQVFKQNQSDKPSKITAKAQNKETRKRKIKKIEITNTVKRKFLKPEKIKNRKQAKLPTFQYVPMCHSRREISKWEKENGKKWFDLSFDERNKVNELLSKLKNN